MIFKSRWVAEDYWGCGDRPTLAPDLRRVLNDADNWHREVAGKPMMVTNVFEKPAGSHTNTHPEGRAVDCRVACIGTGGTIDHYLTDAQARLLEVYINGRWATRGLSCSGQALRVLVVHADPRTGLLHGHFQVGPTREAFVRAGMENQILFV